MSEQDNELLEPLQPDPEPEALVPEPQEDVNKMKTELDSLKSKNEQLYARLKKTEEKTREMKSEPKSEVDFLETAKVAKKYDEDSLEIIANYAKRTGMAIAQAEKDEIVQLAIEAKKEKVAKEKAIPNPSDANLSGDTTSFSEIASMDRKKHMQLEKEYLARKKQNI